jgi:hypothetical protein
MPALSLNSLERSATGLRLLAVGRLMAGFGGFSDRLDSVASSIQRGPAFFRGSSNVLIDLRVHAILTESLGQRQHTFLMIRSPAERRFARGGDGNHAKKEITRNGCGPGQSG